MTLAVGILARGRPEATTQAIISAHNNAGNREGLKIYVLYDNDYECAYKVRDEIAKHLVSSASLNFMISTARLYYVKAANLLKDNIKEELFVFANNDVAFMRDWDLKAIQAYETAPGIIELGSHQTLRCANFVTSKTFLNTVQDGYISYPEYIHYCCDTELMCRAMELGAYHWLAPGVIWHNELDDEVKRGAVKDFWGIDQALWLKRKERFGWPLPLPSGAEAYKIKL